MKKTYYLMDSYEVNPRYGNIVAEYEIEKYCACINGIWYSAFVGFILVQDAKIISFPKHYFNDADDLSQDDIGLLRKLMTKTRSISGLNDEVDKQENFPLLSYMNVCFYFSQYGLYSEKIQIKSSSYKGRINWKSTIRKSSKVISGGNVILLPFIVERNEDLNVFITECMVYVLNHGFKRFGKFFDIGINYHNKTNNLIFRNKALVIEQLKLLKTSHFKDSERLLIESLIDYISWMSSLGKKIILVTKNFESYWEVMIENYLNSRLGYIDDRDNMIFINKSGQFKFRKEQEPIESEKVRSKKVNNRFNVEYDHLYVVEGEIAYLFDSKYYKEVKNANYKQIAYNFILSSSHMYSNKSIVNGLILPTSKKYHKRTHLDTRDRKGAIKGVHIIEHYLNVKDVMDAFIT